MDDTLRQFCQTGRCGEPEPLRAPLRSEALRAHARAAVQAFEAQKAEAAPVDRAAAWLLGELPALITLEEARDVVSFTVARAGARLPLSGPERVIVDVWYRCVLLHREACRAERLNGGFRG